MASGSQISIHLKGLRFFAHHGLYDFEKENGNEFELDASISFERPHGKIIHISDTINYATVHEIISSEMKKPRELLETFLDELAQKLKEAFSQIAEINLTIYKLTAPIEGLTGKVGVSLNISYS